VEVRVITSVPQDRIGPMKVMKNTNLYREHRVYRRLSKAVAVYICLERLNGPFFAVHQMSIVSEREDISVADRINALFAELLLDEDPEIRCTWSSSLQEAIEEHDQAFGN
jgi:hypothetical protein